MKIRTLCASACAIFASFGANAATLDFTIPSGGFTVQSYNAAAGSDPSGSITGGQLTGEAGFGNLVIDVNGENLDIFINGIGPGNPYFDSDDAGKQGGLGNCRNLDATAQCVPNDDDNLTISAGEKLRFDFFADGPSPIDAFFGLFTFRDDNHDLIDGAVQVSHDGGSSIINVMDGIGDLSSIGGSGFLTFNDEPGTTSNLYISEANISAVPVPAAVWLFGSALGALIWRRKT